MRPLKRAVVFDLDGTLLDTTRDIGLALGRTLSAEFTDEQTDRFIGSGLRKALLRAADQIGLHIEDPDAMFRKLVDNYREIPVRYTKPFPGVHGLLRELNGLGTPVCVYTNKEQDLSQTILGICFPDIIFAQITGMHGKYQPKPSSQAIVEFSKLVRIPIADMLYVGDSDIDFNTAVNSGIDYRILTWGTRKKEDLLGIGVPEEALVPDIDKIRDLLV